MADFNGVKNGNTYLDCKDSTARSSISTIEGKIPSSASASNKLATASDLASKVNTSAVGANNGVASLDSTGKVPSSQLPSFVDDVLEYTNQSSFPSTGETGKIYIAKDTNKTYRWSGSAYVEISESLALGETSSTAYAGDKGKANATAISSLQTTVAGKADNTTSFTEASTRANIVSGETIPTILGKIKKFFTDLKTVAFTGSYNDLTNKPTIPSAQVNSDWNASSGVAQILNKPTIPAAVAVKGNAETNYRTGNVNLTPANIGLGNVGNFKAVSTVASQGLTDTEKSNARANIGAGTSSFSGNYNDLSNKPTIPSYGVVSKTANGLAPQLPNETTTTKYLRQDGTWVVPPNTTYSRQTAQAGGTTLSLVYTGDIDNWNNKIDSAGIVNRGTASATETHQQLLWVYDAKSYDTYDLIDGTKYMEQTVTLSTSTTTNVTFTNADITPNSIIEYGCSEWGIVPDNIVAGNSDCVITMPKVSSAKTVRVRIYLR